MNTTGPVIKKTWKELYKKEASEKTETDFLDYCAKNNIFCAKLDSTENFILRKKYLIDRAGPCPDFLITKENISCFVEAKTLTNLTNAKREKEIDRRREFLQKNRQSGILTEGVVDVYSELKGPFRTFIQSAGKKFKNIKSEFTYPCLLLLNGGINVDQITVNGVFAGMFVTYRLIGDSTQCAGFQKNKRGILESSGSSISAIIHWNRDENRYFCLENSRSKQRFPESDFQHFFHDL